MQGWETLPGGKHIPIGKKLPTGGASKATPFSKGGSGSNPGAAHGSPLGGHLAKVGQWLQAHAGNSKYVGQLGEWLQSVFGGADQGTPAPSDDTGETAKGEVAIPEVVDGNGDKEQEAWEPPTRKPLWSMSPDELDEALKQAKDADRSSAIDVFGPERAKVYLQAQRKSNSYMDIEGAKQAQQLVEEMEGSLSDKQRDHLFGIGEDALNADEIREYREALSGLDFGSAKSLGWSLQWALSKSRPGIDPSQMNPSERVAYATLRHAFEEGGRQGLDLEEVSKTALKAAASRFGDPEDAALILQAFLKGPSNQEAQPPRALPDSGRVSTGIGIGDVLLEIRRERERELLARILIAPEPPDSDAVLCHLFNEEGEPLFHRREMDVLLRRWHDACVLQRAAPEEIGGKEVEGWITGKGGKHIPITKGGGYGHPKATPEQIAQWAAQTAGYLKETSNRKDPAILAWRKKVGEWFSEHAQAIAAAQGASQGGEASGGKADDDAQAVATVGSKLNGHWVTIGGKKVPLFDDKLTKADVEAAQTWFPLTPEALELLHSQVEKGTLETHSQLAQHIAMASSTDSAHEHGDIHSSDLNAVSYYAGSIQALINMVQQGAALYTDKTVAENLGPHSFEVDKTPLASTDPFEGPDGNAGGGADGSGHWVTIAGKKVFLTDAPVTADSVFEKANELAPIAKWAKDDLIESVQSGQVRNEGDLAQIVAMALAFSSGSPPGHAAFRAAMDYGSIQNLLAAREKGTLAVPEYDSEAIDRLEPHSFEVATSPSPSANPGGPASDGWVSVNGKKVALSDAPLTQDNILQKTSDLTPNIDYWLDKELEFAVSSGALKTEGDLAQVLAIAEQHGDGHITMGAFQFALSHHSVKGLIDAASNGLLSENGLLTLKKMGGESSFTGDPAGGHWVMINGKPVFIDDDTPISGVEAVKMADSIYPVDKPANPVLYNIHSRSDLVQVMAIAVAQQRLSHVPEGTPLTAPMLGMGKYYGSIHKLGMAAALGNSYAKMLLANVESSLPVPDAPDWGTPQYYVKIHGKKVPVNNDPLPDPHTPEFEDLVDSILPSSRGAVEVFAKAVDDGKIGGFGDLVQVLGIADAISATVTTSVTAEKAVGYGAISGLKEAAQSGAKGAQDVLDKLIGYKLPDAAPYAVVGGKKVELDPAPITGVDHLEELCNAMSDDLSGMGFEELKGAYLSGKLKTKAKLAEILAIAEAFSASGNFITGADVGNALDFGSARNLLAAANAPGGKMAKAAVVQLKDLGNGHLASAASQGAPSAKVAPADAHQAKQHAVVAAYRRSTRQFLDYGVTLEGLMARKVGEQQGSNEGGFYEARDGTRTYVKFLRDADHAKEEHLANLIYGELGIPAPTTRLFVRPDGSTVMASLIVPNRGQVGHADGLDERQARQFLEGYAADVLLANHDVVGTGQTAYDNIVLGEDGQVYRIDNGGSLLHKATGPLKSLGELDVEATYRGFFGVNEHYAAVAKVAGVDEPEGVRGLNAQIKQIVALRDRFGGWRAYLSQVAPQIGAAHRERIAAMLDERTDFLSGKLGEARDREERHAAAEMALYRPHTSNREGYEWARDNYSDQASAATDEESQAADWWFGGSWRENNRLLFEGREDQIPPHVQAHIEALDGLFAKPEAIVPVGGVVLHREFGGMPDAVKEQYRALEPGDIVRTDGYQASSYGTSSQFSDEKGFAWHIYAPQGSRLVCIDGVIGRDPSKIDPDGEREMLIDRGSRFRVLRSYEKGGILHHDVELLG